MFLIDNDAMLESLKAQDDDMEFDWLGMDRNNQLGIFSTFNRGFTPSCVFQSRSKFNELAELIDSLQHCTAAIKVMKKDHNPVDWEDYANKGFFAFDNYDVHRTISFYRHDLLYKPLKPLLFQDVPGIAKFSDIIPVFNLDFGDDLRFEELQKAEWKKI